jgi:hypothetical protein
MKNAIYWIPVFGIMLPSCTMDKFKNPKAFGFYHMVFCLLALVWVMGSFMGERKNNKWQLNNKQNVIIQKWWISMKHHEAYQCKLLTVVSMYMLRLVMVLPSLTKQIVIIHFTQTKMKNFTYGFVIAILLLVCCTGSTNSNNNSPSWPRMKPLAETNWGRIYKYQDGDNIIYLYERSSGGSGISVVNKNCPH